MMVVLMMICFLNINTNRSFMFNVLLYKKCCAVSTGPDDDGVDDELMICFF